MFAKKINFRILSVLDMRWNASKALVKGRPFHALSFRKRGEAVFTHGKKTLKVSAGDIIFVPKDYDYTINSLKSEEVIVVHFDSDDDLGEMETFRPVNSETFLYLFEKIYETWLLRPTGWEFRLDSLFLRIYENIAVQEYGKLYDSEKKFADILAFIRQEFRDPQLNVERLSKEAGVSGTYMRRLFRQKLGSSPLKYLNSVRFDYATALLGSGYYTVEEAAYASGFSDPKNFSVAYKRYAGVSPGKIVKNQLKNIGNYDIME